MGEGHVSHLAVGMPGLRSTGLSAVAPWTGRRESQQTAGEGQRHSCAATVRLTVTQNYHRGKDCVGWASMQHSQHDACEEQHAKDVISVGQTPRDVPFLKPHGLTQKQRAPAQGGGVWSKSVSSRRHSLWSYR